MAKKKQRKHKKKNRVISFFLTLGIILCIGVIGVAGYKLITTWMEYREGDEEYEGLREYTAVVEPEPEEVTPETTGESEVEEEPEEEITAPEKEYDLDMHTNRKPPIDVDWKSLKEINEDIVGWLYIGALDISYPVTQGEDDDYYLHRTFRRENNFAGSIFVEAENSSDFSDSNTIVYGHNMLNGSMFGSLSKLTKESEMLYKKGPYFWILTPNGNYRYKMFSIHVTSVTSDVYTLFTGADEEFISWCKKMEEVSDVDIGKHKYNLNSKVVTLSTCTGDSRSRYVVQGIAVK